MEYKKDLADGVSLDVKMGSDLIIKEEIDVDMKVILQKFIAQVQNPVVKQMAQGLLSVLPLLEQVSEQPKA